MMATSFRVSSPFGSQCVELTTDMRRVIDMTCRDLPTEDSKRRLAKALTQEFKTPNGKQELWPDQAWAIYEAMVMRGAFMDLPVGSGKTIISFLISMALDAKRPVLLIPAALQEKTWHDRRALAEHWHLPTNLQFITYESLSLMQNAKKLDYILPDLIICDEAHYISNPRSGRSRRIRRYMHVHPDTMFVSMSGTNMKKSVKDFGPVARLGLKDRAPVPLTDDELSTWAEALDEGVNPMARRRPGALMQLNGGSKQDGTIEEARLEFQTRFRRSEGVITSSNKEAVGASILVRAVEYRPSAVTEGHFKHVRKLWQTPDGWDFMQAVELRMYLRQLSLGMHGIWRPRPPDTWLNPRKAWHAFARETLKHSRTLDTPLAIANAIDAGHLDDDGALDRWREVEKTFTINPEPVWHDDTAIEVAAKWGENEKGLIWVEHRFYGARLAKVLGTSYYGPGGLDAAGKSIKDEKGGRPVIASVAACKQGFNLQDAFSTNLITCCPSGASPVEQLIGRTHRHGQKADVVTVDIMLGCDAQKDAFDRALAGAKAAEDTLGHRQKLLLADVTMPDITGRRGPLWGETPEKECDCPICLAAKRA